MKARIAKKIYNNLIMGSTRYNKQQIRIACHLAMKYFLLRYDSNLDKRTIVGYVKKQDKDYIYIVV